jgi:hypothetical protein
MSGLAGAFILDKGLGPVVGIRRQRGLCSNMPTFGFGFFNVVGYMP